MAEIRVNATGELKLYDSDDSNYVSFKSGGTVSSNVTWTLPTADGSNGQTLTTNGSGTLSWATASSADPSSAAGDSVGTASAEWSDLYLADGGIVYFGNDQDIRLTHNADKGLIIKHSATADDKPVSLTLQTGETDMAANDVIGKIDFQAPDEGTGTDAVLVAAGIEAVSEGDFSSSNNATKLSFKTAASEAAAEKASLSSTGVFTATSFTGSGAGLTAGTTPVTTLDIDGATDIGEAIVDADLFIIDNGAGGTNRKTAASRLKTYVGSPGYSFVSKTTISSGVAEVEFTGISASNIRVVFQNVGTDDSTGANIRVQLGDSSSYRSGSGTYSSSHHYNQLNSSAEGNEQENSTSMRLCDSIGNTTGGCMGGWLDIYGFSDSSTFKWANFHLAHERKAGGYYSKRGGCWFNMDFAADRIKFFLGDGGDFEEGEFLLFKCEEA